MICVHKSMKCLCNVALHKTFSTEHIGSHKTMICLCWSAHDVFSLKLNGSYTSTLGLLYSLITLFYPIWSFSPGSGLVYVKVGSHKTYICLCCIMYIQDVFYRTCRFSQDLDMLVLCELHILPRISRTMLRVLREVQLVSTARFWRQQGLKHRGCK